MQIHNRDATKLRKGALLPKDAERGTMGILRAIMCGVRVGWGGDAIDLGDDAGVEGNGGCVLEGGVV